MGLTMVALPFGLRRQLGHGAALAAGALLAFGPTYLYFSRFAREDSHTLDGYLATEGYQGLRAALARTPSSVHEEVRSATILGRGGAGFPAGVKWGLTPKGVWPRYLVVNGD